GTRFEELARYSRAVVEGDLVVVSGTVGPDPEGGVMPDSVEEQARNSFATIEQALKQADASLADVLRCSVYVTSAEYVSEGVPVLAQKVDGIRPANTTLNCQIPVPSAKGEIDILARTK